MWEPVTTGHADGVVTLDLAEADDPHRERMRQELGEPYRTLLGHFRHEVGHFYFTVLAPDEQRRERARALFGDERAGYQEALDRHYAEGPPDGWQEKHVSAYATMHPCRGLGRDLRALPAHARHLADGGRVRSRGARAGRAGRRRLRREPAGRAGELRRDRRRAGSRSSYALNAINRSMGRDDLYPFVLAPAVVEKLRLVHELVSEAQ